MCVILIGLYPDDQDGKKGERQGNGEQAFLYFEPSQKGCDGVADPFHSGNISFLRRCRAECGESRCVTRDFVYCNIEKTNCQYCPYLRKYVEFFKAKRGLIIKSTSERRLIKKD